MKKYVVGLLLLVAQNVCGMELDALAIVLKNDEKCKLVAKYLYKYPAGETQEEHHKIISFFKDARLERSVLADRVSSYWYRLHHMEAEEMLHGIYTANLLYDLKKQIFADSLQPYAHEYYACDNALKFVAIKRLSTSRDDHIVNMYAESCFLAEINGKADPKISFFEVENDGDILEDSRVSVGCWVGHAFEHIACTEKMRKELVAFVNAKEDRVEVFKQSYCKIIEDLSSTNSKEGISKFIELLALYKKLPNILKNMYKESKESNVGEKSDNCIKTYCFS